MANMTLKQLGMHILNSGTTILALLAILWFVARPPAQEFVVDSVKEEVTSRIDDLEEGLEKLRQQQAEQIFQQGITASDIGTVKALQKESNRLNEQILQKLLAD
jgi:Tfp pilus assembly protein PilE